MIRTIFEFVWMALLAGFIFYMGYTYGIRQLCVDVEKIEITPMRPSQ